MQVEATPNFYQKNLLANECILEDCAFIFVFAVLSVTGTDNGRGYETWRIAEHRMYPPWQTKMRDNTLDNLLKPECFMTRCWALPYF